MQNHAERFADRLVLPTLGLARATDRPSGHRFSDRLRLDANARRHGGARSPPSHLYASPCSRRGVLRGRNAGRPLCASPRFRSANGFPLWRALRSRCVGPHRPCGHVRGGRNGGRLHRRRAAAAHRTLCLQRLKIMAKYIMESTLCMGSQPRRTQPRSA
jgi:hypothetical protein